VEYGSRDPRLTLSFEIFLLSKVPYDIILVYTDQFFDQSPPHKVLPNPSTPEHKSLSPPACKIGNWPRLGLRCPLAHCSLIQEPSSRTNELPRTNLPPPRFLSASTVKFVLQLPAPHRAAAAPRYSKGRRGSYTRYDAVQSLHKYRPQHQTRLHHLRRNAASRVSSAYSGQLLTSYTAISGRNTGLLLFA